MPQVLGVSFNTILDRIDAGEIPFEVEPLTERKYFCKQTLKTKFKLEDKF